MHTLMGHYETDSPGKPLTHDELRQPFTEAFVPAERWRVGIEAERLGLLDPAGGPVQYDGPQGILAIFHRLVAQRGWTPQTEVPDGPIVALSRAQASITLEPGSQLELSGAPHADLHALAREVEDHARELRAISEPLGVHWVGLGFHPLARQDELGWVPKFRYGLMRVYLASRGEFAHDMMRRTATVQANFDYADETDAIRKMTAALRLSPIVAAMFANAPFVEGRAFGGRSRRMLVWLDVDPDRQGLLPFFWKREPGFDDYIEWALDVPMFLFKRGGTFVQNTGQTFRSFMRDGFKGHRPTLADWSMHLNTLFPEVRLKRTLEVRGADSVPLHLMPSLPALWTGLLYDETSLDQALSWTSDFRFDDLQALRTTAAMHGLEATFQGKPLAEAAVKLLRIASDGLARRGRRDGDARDETVHLEPLAELVSSGRTPADALLARIDASRPLHEQLSLLAPA